MLLADAVSTYLDLPSVNNEEQRGELYVVVVAAPGMQSKRRGMTALSYRYLGP